MLLGQIGYQGRKQGYFWGPWKRDILSST
jgi:hypothetical protein